ncbi:MAG: hypothetical protein ACJ74Z_13295 [Bryobacteraceae bacterium]
MRYPRVLLPVILAFIVCFHLSGQLVVSVHSGVVHFSEGSVFIDDHPLDQKFGTFPNIKEGSTLRTEEGRAEILLTPGVFLRVDENSSIRMVSNALKNTRLEFLEGSAILDSVDASSDDPVVITYKDCQIRFAKKGVYRMDASPPVLQAYNGEAEVTHEGKPSTIDPSHLYFFSLGLVTQKFGEGADDDFYQWSKDRSEFISADNRSASQSTADPGQFDTGQASTRDPDLYLGTPTYGGSIGGTFPVDNGLLYSNVPFGMGVWNAYSVYFIYLPRYYRSRLSPTWPAGTPRSVYAPRSARLPAPSRIPYPGLLPSRIAIPRPSAPTRVTVPSFLPRVPRTSTSTPVYSRPPAVGFPRGGTVGIGTPNIGHPSAIGRPPGIGRR